MAATSIPSVALGARYNSPPRVRLIVLDIGGTLVEDRGNVPDVLRRSLAHHGVDSTPDEISRWRGASKREIIRHFVNRQLLPANADREKLTAGIYDEFNAEIIAIYRSAPAIAGAEDAIRELRQNGYLVATTTGFDRAITESIFGRFDWKKYFVATICSDDVAQGRPSPFMLFHTMESARVNSVAEVGFHCENSSSGQRGVGFV